MRWPRCWPRGVSTRARWWSCSRRCRATCASSCASTPTSSSWSRRERWIFSQVRRLVAVETVHASRLGELEALALDQAVEKIVFDHHERARPEWVKPENLYLTEEGALTTTLVGILAERELAVSRSRQPPSRSGSTRTPARSASRRPPSAMRRRSHGACATARAWTSSATPCAPLSARRSASFWAG